MFLSYDTLVGLFIIGIILASIWHSKGQRDTREELDDALLRRIDLAVKQGLITEDQAVTFRRIRSGWF